MKIKGKSQAKCKQFGGLNNNKVIVETDEFFRDNQNNIRRATNAPSHDDEEMGEVVDAQSVISASYDQVQKGTRKSSAKERKFAIKSSRQKELMDEAGLEYYKPSKGRLSPSAFVDRAAEQTAKIISKYKIDPENYSKYSKNTQQANDALIADLPTMSDLYDLALTDQEYKRSGKSNYPTDEELDYAEINGYLPDSYSSRMQYGGEIKQADESHWYDDIKRKILDTPIGSDFQKRYPTNKEKLSAITEALTYLGPPKMKIGASALNMGLDVADISEGASGASILANVSKMNAKGNRIRRTGSAVAGIYDDIVNIPEKQYGGVIPTSLNGVHDVGRNPVIVPSNNISMENVDFQIDAFDNNTGEYLTRMNPEENYQFNNVEAVREIPVKAQYGKGSINNYSEQILQIVEAMDRTTNPREIEQLQKRIDYLTLYRPDEVTPVKNSAQVYSGVPWNPLERNQKLPIIKGQTQPINGNVIQYSGNNTSQSATSQYSGNNIPEVVPNKSVRNVTSGRKDWDYGNYRTNNLKDGIYTVDKGDWLSSIAASNGLKTEDLIKANPQLKNPNKLNIGDKINIPTNTSIERTQFDTIPNKTIDDTQAGMLYNGEITWDGITPHMSAPQVGPYIPLKNTGDEADINTDVSLGRINKDMSLNAMRQIMLNNRSFELPYRTEVPNRTYKYNEIDATPQLNRIAASTNQQLQNVNMNTSQGQAVANAIAARNLGVENQTLNQIGQQNRQIRTQVDNMNVQALNNFDLLQEQANSNYTNEVYQTLAARDQAKVQAADLLDQAIRERRNTDNAFTMMNMANPNFKIDPRTGEVVRIKKSFKEGEKEKKGRWGFTKRLS